MTRPDTSPDNIARAMREAAIIIASKAGGPRKGFSALLLSAELASLADAIAPKRED